jgi:beta-mannosidase
MSLPLNKSIMKRTILTTLCAFLFALALSADTAQNISLNGVWKLSYWKQPDSAITSPEGMSHIEIKEIPAQVPGNVELDLLSAGLIKDPMIGSNVNLLRPWEAFNGVTPKNLKPPSWPMDSIASFILEA